MTLTAYMRNPFGGAKARVRVSSSDVVTNCVVSLAEVISSSVGVVSSSVEAILTL